MPVKSKRFKVEHDNFKKMRGGFEDCIRYSQAKEIEYSRENDYAIIEIPPVGNPSMRKEGLQLYIKRWESFGFRLTKMRCNSNIASLPGRLAETEDLTT